MMPLEKRGNFHVPYASRAGAEFDQRREKTHRLMDLMIVIEGNGHPDFAEKIAANDFAVVDVLREERGLFELPEGTTPEQITAMIQSTFNARALRVSPRVWIV